MNWLKNWKIPYNWHIVPINFHLIIIKINPIPNARDPLIFLAKNINVSLTPTKMNNPQINNKFPNIKNALSKKNKTPNPYKTEDIIKMTVPSSILF